MRKEQFDITGMTCSACSSRVESCVVKLPGVKDVSVNLLKNTMSVSYDENSLNTEGIVSAVESSGYGAKPKGDWRYFCRYASAWDRYDKITVCGTEKF